jgi:hypothetical protein
MEGESSGESEHLGLRRSFLKGDVRGMVRWQRGRYYRILDVHARPKELARGAGRGIEGRIAACRPVVVCVNGGVQRHAEQQLEQ